MKIENMKNMGFCVCVVVCVYVCMCMCVVGVDAKLAEDVDCGGVCMDVCMCVWNMYGNMKYGIFCVCVVGVCV